MLDVPQELQPPPEHAGGNGLAGVGQARSALLVPADRHRQVDLGRIVPDERRPELVVELLGDAVRQGPAEDREAEVGRGSHGRLRRRDVVGMSRHASGIEHHEPSCSRAAGCLDDLAHEGFLLHASEGAIGVVAQLR